METTHVESVLINGRSVVLEYVVEITPGVNTRILQPVVYVIVEVITVEYHIVHRIVFKIYFY